MDSWQKYWCATLCVPFVQVSGTVDASWSLLKIDEYLVNPE
jgi:hypothetical protein